MVYHFLLCVLISSFEDFIHFLLLAQSALNFVGWNLILQLLLMHIPVNVNDYNLGASSKSTTSFRAAGGVFTTPAYQSHNVTDPFSRVSNVLPFNTGICSKIHVFNIYASQNSADWADENYSWFSLYFCNLGSRPWGLVNTQPSYCIFLLNN